MGKETPEIDGKPAVKTRKDMRAERLAAELRANLTRRKAAAKARDGLPESADGSETPPKS